MKQGTKTTAFAASLVIKGKKYYEPSSIRRMKKDVQAWLDGIDYVGESGYVIEKVTVTINKV